jgi:very-short-patch-repair endonuclease
MIGRARRLRRNTTEAERLLWDALRKDQLGWRFRRQHPIPPYVVDFACVEALVWKHASSSRPMVDSMAALAIIMLGIKQLRRGGWRILRFWNNDILENCAGVLETIAAALGPHITIEPPP